MIKIIILTCILLGTFSAEQTEKAFMHYQIYNIELWWPINEKEIVVVLKDNWSFKHKVVKIEPTDRCNPIYLSDGFIIFTLCHTSLRQIFYVDPTPYEFRSPLDMLWKSFIWEISK